MKIAFLATLVGSLSFATMAHADTIRLRADAWCPYNCTPWTEKPGYMIEIAQEIFGGAGHKVIYENMAWSRALAAARAGEIEGVIGASGEDSKGFILPQRELAIQKNCFYVKKDSNWKFENIDSLNSITLGAVQDYSYEDALNAFIEKNKGKKVKLITGDDTTMRNLEKTVAGRIDGLVEDATVATYFFKNSKDGDKVKLAGCTAKKEPLYIAFSAKAPKAKEYAKILSDGIDSMRKSGKLKTILDKYGLSDWK